MRNRGSGKIRVRLVTWPNRTALREFPQAPHHARHDLETGGRQFPIFPNATTCYVEAPEEQEFAIMIELLDFDRDFRDDATFDIWIDGKKMDSYFLAKSSTRRRIIGDRVCTIGNGQACFQRMMFSSFSLAGRNRRDVMDPSLFEMGSIRIDCIPAKIRPVEEPRRRICPRAVFPGLVQDQQIFEDDLEGKLVELGVELGEPQFTRGPLRIETSFDEEPPVATFIFKYRSRPVLQGLGFIEETPEPDADE